MNSPNGKSGQWEFTGWHMLFVMMAFFGVVIAVNVTMAVLAGSSWTGLVVKNSYVASQQYNGELKEARRQAARGWQSTLTYAGAGLEFELKDRAGQPVLIEDLKAAIGRPAFEAQDQMVALRPLGAGRYRGDVVLAPGEWMVKITGGAGEMAYRRDDRIDVAKAAAR